MAIRPTRNGHKAHSETLRRPPRLNPSRRRDERDGSLPDEAKAVPPRRPKVAGNKESPKEMVMRTRFALVVVTTMVAVAMLALSGVAWAAVAPLTVTKTMPSGGAKGVALKANVKAYFNHDMRASTVTSATFKIRKLGASTWLGATRSVNNAVSPTSTNGGSQSVATLNPRADLAPGTTYEVMVVGGSSGVKAVNGKALGTNKRWTFTTVATPPNTTIGSGPTGTVASGSASFSFSSSKAGSTFQCSLDAGAYGACTSPKNYTDLPDGQHTFSVRATDAAGNTDPTPAGRYHRS